MEKPKEASFSRDQHDSENDLKCKASKKNSIRLSRQTVSNRNRETAYKSPLPQRKKRDKFFANFCRRVRLN